MKIYLLFLLALAGCAESQPVFKPIEVDVPVAAPCQTVALDRPQPALTPALARQSLAEKLRAALFDLRNLKAYADALETEIKVCQ